MHRWEVQAMCYQTGTDKQGSRVSLNFCYGLDIACFVLTPLTGEYFSPDSP